MVKPGLAEYLQRSENEGLIPVWEEAVVDCETPISLYQKLARGEAYSYLLESVEGGEQVARYSFIGINPLLVMRARGTEIETEEDGQRAVTQGDPLRYIRRVLNSYRVGQYPELPRFFGGAVGYFAYDLVRRLERLPGLTSDDLGLPDCYLVVSGTVLIYDHVQRALKTVVLSRVGSDPAAEYYRAVEQLREIRRRLEEVSLPVNGSGRLRTLTSGVKLDEGSLSCNTTRERFQEMVLRAKEYIVAGDVFQVVLSRRWSRRFDGDPFEVYRVVRVLNPSPYMFYINYPGLQLVGASPEMLVRVEGGRLQHRPIAGTRPRGNDPQEDARLADELKHDEKERAEHVMLVDLGRNDVGKVCRYGSVEVPRFMEVERYSHVMHLVSQVEGILGPGRDAMDALAACFPAGTLSGAPKVRAMEIIEELEPTRRGPYGGAVGYLGLNGNLDTCITIRTAVFHGGRAYVQAGAGIVADSEPQQETLECWNKARATLVALKIAEEGE